MKEGLNVLPPIDVVTLGSMLGVLAACLLLNGMGLYLLFRFVIERRARAAMREEVREHEAAVKQARQSVGSLLELCASLKPAPRHTSGEHEPGISPTMEVSRPFMTELLALEKVLHHFDRLLEDGIVPRHLEFFQAWYNDLRDRFEEALRPRVLSPLIISALVIEAEQIWRDTVTFTLTPKSTLLECLQHSVMCSQRALAEAARTLARSQGSDAGWKASGEYRKALIHWAACAAIRLVLKHKKGEINLDDPQVVESHFVEFERMLAQKCNDDQIILAQALYTNDERAEKPQVLLPA
jgi:hypothetical protein